MKKPKLDAEEGEPGKPQAVEPTEEAEEELLEEAIDEPEPSMDVDETAPTTETKDDGPKIRFKKGKTAEGASAHFKENPYTFIEPDDPIIGACTYEPFLPSSRPKAEPRRTISQ